MKEQLIQRLKSLQEEYQKGQERMVILEQETRDLQTTMLRISGAIQVLEELIEEASTKTRRLEKKASI